MKVFLYARKSTDDEERQILSIDAQRNELREYAKKQGLVIVREFVESMTAKEPGTDGPVTAGAGKKTKRRTGE